jgi:hypothetical protein
MLQFGCHALSISRATHIFALTGYAPAMSSGIACTINVPPNAAAR